MASSCRCCKCFPLVEVPVTDVPGATAAAAEWVRKAGGPKCCWSKYFDYDGTPAPYYTYATVYHVRLDSSVDYQFMSSFYGVVMTGSTEYKLERWKRLKATSTIIPDPVTGKDVSITWSKVCDAICDYGVPADYYVLEYTQRLQVVVTEEWKTWQATRYVATATQPGVVPKICVTYDDGKWFGGTIGGTYVTNSSTVPAQEDIWQYFNTLFSSTIEVRRYKLFATLPEDPTQITIDESEDIPDCKKTICMVDEPLDGYGFDYDGYGDTEGLCYFAWSIVTDASQATCGGVPYGYPNHIRNQDGNDASGFFGAGLLLANPCTPHPLGGFHCFYKEYSNLVYTAVCDPIGTGTFYFTPAIDLVVSAA